MSRKELDVIHDRKNWHFVYARRPKECLSALLLGALIVIAWVLLGFLLYGFQLSGGWRFDDGHHLGFLSQYSNFEYIYNPEAARLQSGAHYTPFNILTYDLIHRLVPLTAPVWFYAFHIVLIGVATSALFLYLNLAIGRIGAICGAAVFIAGFPVAGMSGQLMVGHYVIGFGFAGLCLYFYERAAQEDRYSFLAVALFFLACLSKEIFLPLILFIALDPRFTFRRRLVRVLPWLAAVLAFWSLRTWVVGKVVGGYNDGLPVPPLIAVTDILEGLYAYGTMTIGAVVMSLLVVACGLIAFISLLQRFGPLNTAIIAGGAICGIFLPLLPVAPQVSPQAPTEIRLVSGLWFVLSLAVGFAMSKVAILSTVRQMRILVGGMVILVTTWATVGYVRISPLFPFGREFDAVSQHLFSRNACYIVDKYGWSSWLYDLNRAVWPQSSPPLMAPREILNAVGMPGHPICEFDSAGMRGAGEVEAKQRCVTDGSLSLNFFYNGSHLIMNFGPSSESIYYIEVPGAYYLKLPAEFTMPFPDKKRLKVFRLMKINKHGKIDCSPILHFDPEAQPKLHWNRTAITDSGAIH